MHLKVGLIVSLFISLFAPQGHSENAPQAPSIDDSLYCESKIGFGNAHTSIGFREYPEGIFYAHVETGDEWPQTAFDGTIKLSSTSVSPIFTGCTVKAQSVNSSRSHSLLIQLESHGEDKLIRLNGIMRAQTLNCRASTRFMKLYSHCDGWLVQEAEKALGK